MTAPKRIVLEDTGERRIPKGEPYVYLGPHDDHREGSLVDRLGCQFEGADFSGKPEDFAIYRIVEVDEVLEALRKCVDGLGCQPGYVNSLALTRAQAAIDKVKETT